MSIRVTRVHTASSRCGATTPTHSIVFKLGISKSTFQHFSSYKTKHDLSPAPFVSLQNRRNFHTLAVHQDDDDEAQKVDKPSFSENGGEDKKRDTKNMHCTLLTHKRCAATNWNVSVTILQIKTNAKNLRPPSRPRSPIVDGNHLFKTPTI